MNFFQNLSRQIKRKEAKIGIIGLGYVGLPLALQFCKKKYRVVGFDIDKKKIQKLKKNQSYINHIPNSLIKIELQIQYWFDSASAANYAVFTVYRDGTINLSDIPVSLDMNASYTGTSTGFGIWFGANTPNANYNDSAVVRVFDKPHTTDQIIYKPYSRLYASGRLYWNWGSQHDSMVISEIKQ